MMTYYVKTPEMVVSILSNGVGNLFSVHPAADDDLHLTKVTNMEIECWDLQL